MTLCNDNFVTLIQFMVLHLTEKKTIGHNSGGLSKITVIDRYFR